MPRLTQDVGRNTLAKIGVALTESDGSMRNVIDIYTEVANKMKDMNEVEKSSVRFGLGGTFHAQRLQVLLDDLGKADSMYRQMYETSVNSAGSAMIENEKYMDSLQARINSMKIEFEKLAVATGEAFVSSGMIEFMKIASTFLQTMTKMVDSVGLLPIIFATASMAVLTFSNRAKTLTGALTANVKAMYSSATATVGHSQSINKAIVSSNRLIQTTTATSTASRKLVASTTAVKNASSQMANQMKITSATMVATTRATTMLATAGRTIGSAFVWTLPFVALGFLVEKLTAASAKSRELKESAVSANKEMMTSFKSNQDELTTLNAKYAELEQAINSGNYDNQTLAEYHAIQNKIANLMPTLITGEDAYGNKLVESSTVIQTKIDMLKEQLEIEKNIANFQARQERDDRITGNETLLDDNSKALKNELGGIQALLDTTGIDITVKELDDVTEALKLIGKARKEAEQSGNDKLLKMYDNLSKKIIEAQQAANGFTLSTKNAQSLLKIDYLSKINDTLKDNADYWGSSTTEVANFMGELMKLSDVDSVERLNEALMSISINGSAGQEITDIIGLFEKLNDVSDGNFSNVVSDIESSMSKLRDSLKKTGMDDSDIDVIMETLVSKLNIAKTKFSEIEAELKQGGGTWEEAAARVAALDDGMSGLEGSADDAEDALNKLTSSISYINGVLEDYAESNKLSTSTMMELIDKYPKLIAHINDEGEMIKALKKIRDDDVNAAKQQLAAKIDASEDYYNANLKMIEAYFNEHFKFYKGDLTQFKTLAQAKADVENELINSLAKQWSVYYSSITNDFMPDLKEWSTPNSSFALPGVNVEVSKETQDAIDRMKGANAELEEARNKLQNFTLDRVDLDFSKIGTSLDKTTKSAKESAKAQKESIYLSDKFKQSLEAVNLAIEKQQAIQNKHPKHSEAYRKSLEAQLKLENEKLRLIQEQSAALDKQIKAGKIAQTGSVTIGDGNSKTTTSKSKKLSGWEGKITDTYGTYRSIRNGRMHTGVDVAGKTGTRLDSNVAGKVTGTGKTALSGNFVKVLDDKGMTHFYGHLDKIVAKLGDVVKAGDQIGNIGNTGNSTGSHLHYQITDTKGNTFDPMKYVTAAKSMVVSSEQISSVVSNTKQSIDDAKSTLVGLQGDALKQMQTIADLEKAIIDSQLVSFDFKRQGFDEIVTFEEAKLKNVTVGTTQYTKTLEKQQTVLKAKQKVNNDELAYVEGLIKDGNLSAITLVEMKARTMELKTAIQNLNAELGNLALDKIIDAHDAYSQKQDNTIDFEKNKLNELDKNSSRYVATLEKLNTHMNRKILTHQDTIKSIENEIKVLGLQGDALKRAKDTIQSLTLEMQNFKQDMSDNNYEIIVNVKTRYDEKNDDLQFEIDRSKAIQALYKEGSADAANEIRKQIGWQEQLVQSYDASRKALQAELNTRDILPERIKEVTELMEDETVAYWNAKRAVEELNESLEETRKKLLNDIADKFINALKKVYEEQRDMALDAIDDEMEANEKAHEARIKQLNDEMDLFRKNVEEKLRLLDRQDAERSYNMEIDEMETERDKLVDQINLLSLDDSHEAKSKKKKLLEQLDKLDKDINEKRYQRDLELQKQGLNDLLEDKETEIEIVEENYDKQNEATLESLRQQRKYWEQYYTDLLNDERKFASVREDILNGHFDKVVNEFEAHMAEMIATMPQLTNTMNSTMQAVGTAIRQNVIDEIQRAIDALREFQDMQVATNLHVDDFDPNASKDMTYQGNTGSKPSNTTPSPSDNNSNSNNSGNKGQVYASLNKGDLQVLLGKFINDAVAPDFKAETKERIALKAEGERIAGLGRANSSQIPRDSAFNNEMGKLTSAQIEQLKSFIQSNSGSILGGNYTSAFNKNLASLHTGGMTKYNGTGNDGIGGKLAMLHPNEIVLNPLQSDEMLKSSSILQNIMKMITPVISKFPTPSSIMNNSSSKGDLIINIDNVHNTNDRDAQHFVNQIGDALRTKGMW